MSIKTLNNTLSKYYKTKSIPLSFLGEYHDKVVLLHIEGYRYRPLKLALSNAYWTNGLVLFTDPETGIGHEQLRTEYRSKWWVSEVTK